MNYKVLIIDDDKIIRKITSRMVQLCRPSFSEPLLFENGMEALNYLLREKDKHLNYILLLDINMPILNGWKFLEKLEKEKLTDKKIIYLMTSSVDIEDHRKGEDNDYITAVITKPITLRSIESILEVN